MTNDQIKLQFGEMTAAELRTAKAIVDWHERQMAAMESKHQTAISCLADERRKKEAAIAERDALKDETENYLTELAHLRIQNDALRKAKP